MKIKKQIIQVNELGIPVVYENDIVLDPFMGSGSTAIACINTNRRYIGYEIDDEYYNIAVKRVKENKHNKEG